MSLSSTETEILSFDAVRMEGPPALIVYGHVLSMSSLWPGAILGTFVILFRDFAAVPPIRVQICPSSKDVTGGQNETLGREQSVLWVKRNT